MKSKIYLSLFCLCFSLNLSAQNYSTLITEDWKNGIWKNNIRISNTFDSKGIITYSTTDSWNATTNIWDKSMNTTNTLNSNSTINISFTQRWDKDANKWVDYEKKLYTYDGSKNILTIRTQILMGTLTFDNSLKTNTYNSTGQLIKIVDQQLDYSTMQLKNSYQTTYTYNADGTENQNIFQSANILTGVWENTRRTTNTYNASKAISSTLTESYSTSGWVNSTKVSATFNTNGSVKDVLNQDWDLSGSKWVDTGKDIYSYTANGSINQILLSTWKDNLKAWENQTKVTFTYNATSVFEPKMAGAEQLMVFPNPFSDVISIEYSNIKESRLRLYNTNGQLIRVFLKGEPLSKINLSDLKNGIYFMKVVSPESSQEVKLLKISN